MALAVAGVLLPTQAHAVYVADGGRATNNTTGIAIGSGSEAQGGGAIALGANASTASGINTYNQSIAIGVLANAKGDQAIALGANTNAGGNSSVAIGGDDLDYTAFSAAGTNLNSSATDAKKTVFAENKAAVVARIQAKDATFTEQDYQALGDNEAARLLKARNMVLNNTAEASLYNTLTGDILVDFSQDSLRWVGTRTGKSAVAVGVQANAHGALSTAFGTRAVSANDLSVALGVGARADKDGAIALGAGSKTDLSAVEVNSVTIEGTTFDGFTGTRAFAGTTGQNVGRQLSVGSAGFERQIKSVAPGRIASDSTDAINGSQLYSVALKLVDTQKVAQKGWHFKADKTSGDVNLDTPANIAPGETMTFLAGDNILLTQKNADQALEIATKADVKFDSVTLGNATTGAKLTASGLNVQNGGQTSNIGAGNISVANGTGTALNLNASTGDLTGLGNKTLGSANFAQTGRAATEEQLSLAQSSVANLLGGNVQNVGGTLSNGFTVGGTAYSTVADAIQSKSVNVVAGKNIEVTATATAKGTTFTVLTADDVNFDSVTLGNATTGAKLTASGLNVQNGGQTSNIGAGNISVANGTGTTLNLNASTGDLTGLGNKTLGNANFAQAGRAATEEQLNLAQNSVADIIGGGVTNKGGKLSGPFMANGNAYKNIADAIVGESGKSKTTVVAGKNMAVTANGTTYTVATADDVNFDSVTLGDTTTGVFSQLNPAGLSVKTATGATVVNGNGLSFQDTAGQAVGPKVNAQGIDAGQLLITNVAAGSIASGSRDAVNGSQIHDLVGGGAYQDAKGNVMPTVQNIGGTGATNIHDAILSLNQQSVSNKPEVVAGDNMTVSKSLGGNKQDVYTVATKKDLVLNSVSIDDGKGQTVTLDKNGTTVTQGNQSAHYGAKGSKMTDTQTGNSTVVNQAGVSFQDAQGKATGPSMAQTGIDAGQTKITNVAAGTADTDAVNVSQLNQLIQQNNAINNNIAQTIGDTALLDTYNVQGQDTTERVVISEAINNINRFGIRYAHTNGAANDVAGSLNNRTNDSSAGGANSTAMGVNAIVEQGANSALALGHDTFVNASAIHSVAIGFGSNVQAASAVALGDNALVSGASGVAIGHGAQAIGSQSISIGTGNVVRGNNSGAIGDPSYINADNAYGIGNNNKIDANQSFVLGNEVTIGAAAADMKQANGAAFAGSVALGHGTTLAAPVATTGIKILPTDTKDRAFAGTKPVGTVSVGSAGAERTVTNVAAGRISATSTDAINGSQLYQTNAALGQLANGAMGVVQYSNADAPTVANGGVASNNVTLVGGSPSTVDVNGDGVIDANDGTAPVHLSNVAEGRAPTDAVNVSQLNGMGNALNNRISNVEKEARAGTATAIAVANLPQVYLPGKSGIAMATGTYEGQVGYALGYSAISDGGKWVFKASATGSQNGAIGGGAGVLYMFE